MPGNWGHKNELITASVLKGLSVNFGKQMNIQLVVFCIISTSYVKNVTQ